MTLLQQTKHTRTAQLSRTLAILLAGACLWVAPAAFANHPVFLEGETDFDGDGLLGVDEDVDNDTDQVFGTIAAALAAANRAANQNGHVICVTSGRFNEQVNITAANGDVSLQAAEGVYCAVEAVRAGDPNSATRQGQPGIIIAAPANRRVTIRNFVVRNWTEGIQILGSSSVTIDNCRVEHNRDFNIHVADSARLTLVASHVNAAGFRQGANIDNTPNPGTGIAFDGSSVGVVADTTVSGNFSAGVSNTTGRKQNVEFLRGVAFNNASDFIDVKVRR
ncbi:MAG: right-handed parallel beta-helix repeat-containing protein [Candidatus Binatia bacterium]